MEDIDEKIFDTFSEYIDKDEEHRFINFRGKPIFWMERTPLNEKQKVAKAMLKKKWNSDMQKET